jgi:hypothetical protein
MTHSTETHKTKEEIHGAGTGSSRAGMARVDFDLHPAAFKATVKPFATDPSIKKASVAMPLNLFTLTIISLISILANWMKNNWSIILQGLLVFECSRLQRE